MALVGVGMASLAKDAVMTLSTLVITAGSVAMLSAVLPSDTAAATWVSRTTASAWDLPMRVSRRTFSRNWLARPALAAFERHHLGRDGVVVGGPAMS